MNSKYRNYLNLFRHIRYVTDRRHSAIGLSELVADIVDMLPTVGITDRWHGVIGLP